jgi:phage terminase large subunit-like protein
MAKVVSLAEKRKKAHDAKRRHYDKNSRVYTGDGFRSMCVYCGDEFFTPRRNVKVCGEGGCKKVLAKGRLKPFTMPHFKKWASQVILDTDKPWKLEPFQIRFIEDLFAGKQEAWLMIGEGNGKTTTFAGFALYHIQFRRSGRVPVAAATRDQAFELYLQAQGMVEHTPSLGPIFTCHEGLRQIKCESMGSRIQVYASDDRSGDGVIFTLALVDELHRHRDLRLYRTWVGKTQKRGGQVAVISTAGEPGSEFEGARDRIRQTADKRAEIEPGYIRAESTTTVFHEYAVPERVNGKQPNVEDMGIVKMANPFSGITLKSLEEKRNSPTMTLQHWMRFTCNLAARGTSAGVSEIEWNRQCTNVRIPPGVPIWAGLDVAWRGDTTALVPLWIREFEFRLLGAPTILVPPRDGTSLNPDVVEDALLSMNDENPIHTLVMDTTKAEQLASWAEKTLGCEVIDRGQSNTFQALDYERWSEAIREGWLYHCGDNGLTEHVMNAIAIELPGGKTRFDRPKRGRGVNTAEQGRRVIDALVAACMVHTSASSELLGEGLEGGVIYG